MARSHTRRLSARVALASLLATACLTVALAQSARRDAGGANRLQAAVQQLAAERERLSAENAQLKEKLGSIAKELEIATREREALENRARRTESDFARAEAGRQNLNASLDAARGRLDEVLAKYRELTENLRHTEAERSRLQGELAAGRRELESCQVANVELAGLAEEVLLRYEEKSCFTALAQREPFTQITRTRIGNLVDGYRARIAEKTLAPAPQPPDTAGEVR